jgi:hypothetical protein
LSSGEPSRAALVDMAGGRRRDAIWATGDGRRARARVCNCRKRCRRECQKLKGARVTRRYWGYGN